MEKREDTQKMAKNTVTIGCPLPHGIVLGDHRNPKTQFELKGTNKATIIGAKFATTEVDAELWEKWFSENKNFPAVKSGAIFPANNESAAASIAKELNDKKHGQKTGFEPLDPDSHGVKPAEKE